MIIKTLELLRVRLKERLQEKTSWGRNELMLLIEEVISEVLAELLEEKEK